MEKQTQPERLRRVKREAKEIEVKGKTKKEDEEKGEKKSKKEDVLEAEVKVDWGEPQNEEGGAEEGSAATTANPV